MKATKHALAVALGLISLMVPAKGMADIITNYEINFTTTSGGPAPLSGSFTYDSTHPLFSNFLVRWNGLTFDLTSSANAPGKADVAFTGCTGESSPTAAYGFALITQELTGCNVTYSWQALSHTTPPPQVSGLEFDASSTTIIATDQLLALNLATPANAPADAHGTWSVTPVPEPPSAQLAAIGFLALIPMTWLAWRRKRLA